MQQTQRALCREVAEHALQDHAQQEVRADELQAIRQQPG
ncbi:DUF1059 domain-containing protein [Xanthomonas sp. LMG 12461]|nr:DUF1059 domain-containing protein [Xanthomonas sp. LMG 12461]